MSAIDDHYSSLESGPIDGSLYHGETDDENMQRWITARRMIRSHRQAAVARLNVGDTDGHHRLSTLARSWEVERERAINFEPPVGFQDGDQLTDTERDYIQGA